MQKAEATDLAASGIEILQPIGALRKSPDGIRVEIDGKGSVDFELSTRHWGAMPVRSSHPI